MHRSIAGYTPCYLFILTIDYSKNFTTMLLLTIEHMAMFVDKFIHIRINGQVYGSINYTSAPWCCRYFPLSQKLLLHIIVFFSVNNPLMVITDVACSWILYYIYPEIHKITHIHVYIVQFLSVLVCFIFV